MPNAPEKPLHERIRHRRHELGIPSQEALAELIGTKRLHVNAWETGRHSPSSKYAEKLASVLGGEAKDWMNNGRVRRYADTALLEATQSLARSAQSLTEQNQDVLRLLGEIRTLVARLAPGPDETPQS